MYVSSAQSWLIIWITWGVSDSYKFPDLSQTFWIWILWLLGNLNFWKAPSMFLTIRTKIRSNSPYLLLFKLYFVSLRTWNCFPWFSPLIVSVGVRVGREVLHIMLRSQEVRNTHLCSKERGDWMARLEMDIHHWWKWLIMHSFAHTFACLLI